MRIGVVRVAKIGMADANAVKVAETRMANAGATGMAKIGAVEVVGGVVIGIHVSAATSGSLKVFAIRRMNILSKGKIATRG